jgi:hypothetical protein
MTDPKETSHSGPTTSANSAIIVLPPIKPFSCDFYTFCRFRINSFLMRAVSGIFGSDS